MCNNYLGIKDLIYLVWKIFIEAINSIFYKENLYILNLTVLNGKELIYKGEKQGELFET